MTIEIGAGASQNQCRMEMSTTALGFSRGVAKADEFQPPRAAQSLPPEPHEIELPRRSKIR